MAILDSPRAARWLIAGILLWALGLRLYFCFDARLSVDLGTAYSIAWGMVHDNVFPTHGGPSTWGGNLFLPGYYYLVTAPLLLSDSPRLFFAWGPVFTTLGLIPFALMLLERYGPRAAVLGTWFVASAPWFVLYGDSPWSPKMAMPFVATLLYALHRTVAVPRSRWAAAVPLCLAGQAEIYPNLPPTLAMVLAVTVLCRPRVNARWLALGILLAAASVAPTALHLLERAPTPATQLFTHREAFDRVHSAILAIEHPVLYSSAAARFGLGGFGPSVLIPNATWHFSAVRRLATWLFGSKLVAFFVGLSVLFALVAWARALWAGARTVWREPSRAWDPLAVALCAGLVAVALVGYFGLRRHVPQYSFVVGWCSVLPLVWLVGGKSALASPRLRLVVTVLLLASAALHVQVCRWQYRREVAPMGLRTGLQAIATIARRERGHAFMLDMPEWQVNGWNRLAWRILGRAQWRCQPYAPVRYRIARAPLSFRDIRRVRQKGVRFWRLRYAWLARIPGKSIVRTGSR